MDMKEFWTDVAWGALLAGILLCIVMFGSSGPKFIYIDF